MPSKSSIIRPLTYLAPNGTVVLVAGGGWLTETFLVGRALLRGADFDGLALAMAVAWLAWFWYSAGWLMWWGARRPKARWVLTGILAVAGLGYLASWGLFLRAQQFANVESVGFAIANARQLPQYLKQMEPASLWRLLLLSAGICAGLPFVLRRAGSPAWPVTAQVTRVRRIVWYGVALVALSLLLSTVSDRSKLRREARLYTLGHCVNPVFTLAASGLETVCGEGISPDLNIAGLRPIHNHDDWQPPPRTASNRPSIILVGVESLRADVVGLRHQGLEIMPQLNDLATRGVELTRAYSASTHSDYSYVCVPSSLLPLWTRRHHYYNRRDPWPKTLIYDLLKQAGYATAIISSQNEGWGRMDQFLASPNLDLFIDAQNSRVASREAISDTGVAEEVAAGALHAGNLDDQVTMNTAIAWLERQGARRSPFFLSVTFQGSHFPYELTEGTPRPFQPAKIDFPVSFLNYPVTKTNILRNAYFNALHESDRQLGRLVEALRRLGRLENTILVVYGDHGEAFYENGLPTHAQHPFESALRVACVVHAPGHLSPAREDYPVSLVDVAPTILGLLGWPLHPNFQGIDCLATNRPPLDQRLLFFHVENGVDRADAVLLAGRWKYAIDRYTHAETLFDLVEDPQEKTNQLLRLPGLAQHLAEICRQWRRQQLTYYHYPSFYQRFYPPPPPSWGGTTTSTGAGNRPE